MMRLKSLEGSDSTALALLSNDINASVALCRELLGSRCCSAAFVMGSAEDAAADVASHHDRVMFHLASASSAVELVGPSLQLLQECLRDSELPSNCGALTPIALADAIKCCRRVVYTRAPARLLHSSTPFSFLLFSSGCFLISSIFVCHPCILLFRACVASLVDLSEIAKKRLSVLDQLKQQVTTPPRLSPNSAPPAAPCKARAV
jgi:hypothetical protein